MLSRALWGLGVLAVVGTVTGCYLSHSAEEERARDMGPDARLPRADGSSPADASPDACIPIRVRVMETRGVYNPFPSSISAWMFVEGGEGWSPDNVLRPDAMGYIEGCLPNAHAPYLLFVEHPLFVTGIVGARGALETEIWQGESAFLDRGIRYIGRHAHPVSLVHRQPDSSFLARVNEFYDLPYPPSEEFRCQYIGGIPGRRCRSFLLELSAEGELLGGVTLEHQDSEPELITFDTSESRVAQVTFEAPLPQSGLLSELRLVNVEALACNEGLGIALPGERDVMRCPRSGLGTIDETTETMARGHVDFVVGPSLVTNRLVAEFQSSDGNLEAHLYIPCCEDRDSDGALRFPAIPETRSLQGGGSSPLDVWAEVDAPGLDHGFLAGRRIDRSTRIRFEFHGFEETGRLSMESLPTAYKQRFDPDRRDFTLREVWVGATSTVDGDPWGHGLPTASVRRRIHYLSE